MSIARHRGRTRGPSTPPRDVQGSGTTRGLRLRPGHHVCWIYEHRADFERAAASFLAAGLDRHDRVQLVVPWSRDAAGGVLEGIEGFEEAVREGALEIIRLPDDPSSIDHVAHFRDETARALADGRRGLTVAVDVTPMVLDDDDRTRFLAHEHQLDRWMTMAPFAVLCAYEHGVVGDDALKLAALHPETNHDVDFNVFAAGEGWLQITGAIDALNVHLFEDVVEGALGGMRSPVDIDARTLQYINQRGLLAVDSLADRVNVVTNDPQVIRLARSLRATHLEVRIG